jgi:hypothetical protein
MLNYEVSCNNKPVILQIGVAVRVKSVVCIQVLNPDKRNTVYMDRWQTVNDRGEFDVRLPQNCKRVLVKIWMPENNNDQDIRITKFSKKKIENYLPCVSGGYKVREFVKFAQFFAENCGDLSTGTYYSDNEQFRIDYLPTITNNGQTISTPARISNKNGRMEISQQAFLRYTVPMRMAIMLHEYAHFNMNEVQEDEVEADLNGLKIYLGIGYPVIEAHKSFLEVFEGTPTEENKKRYGYIKSFIDNFDRLKYKICLP